MSRHPAKIRQQRRALAIGAGLSIALHAAALAFLKIDVPVFERSEPRLIVFDDAPPPEPDPVVDPIEVIDLLESAPAMAAPAATAATADAAGSPPSAATAVGGGSPAAVAPPVSDDGVEPVVATAERSYDQLVVLDPLREPVEPIAFNDLPVADVPAAAKEEDEVAVYVPGSIGKAKRGWASAGTGAGSNGDSGGWTAFIGPGGDGHCPMPSGRPRGGRIPNPLWNRIGR